MNEIWTTVVGNVVTDPRHWRTEAGLPVLRFRLASTPGNYEQGQWVDRATTYLTVMSFRHVANNAASSLTKGQPILAYGKLSVRAYTTADGRTEHETQLEAIAIGHNLARGTTMFHRPAKPAAAVPAGVAPDAWSLAAERLAETESAVVAHADALDEPDDIVAAGLAAEFGGRAPGREEPAEVDAA